MQLIKKYLKPGAVVNFAQISHRRDAINGVIAAITKIYELVHSTSRAAQSSKIARKSTSVTTVSDGGRTSPNRLALVRIR
jgi:hypothetical protein